MYQEPIPTGYNLIEGTDQRDRGLRGTDGTTFEDQYQWLPAQEYHFDI